MQKRLKKYSRDEETFQALAHRQITDRSLEIIANLAHYHILPTSLLVRLSSGNEGITRRHLQTLYHQRYINFFVFPRLRNVSEHHFYLDNPAALELLIEHKWAEPQQLDFDRVRYNRDKKYYEAHLDPDRKQGQLLFLKHESDVSRFHAMLELGCRASGGKIELIDWRQGPELWQKIAAPKMTYDNQRDLWGELGETETLPHRPDSLFGLRFLDKPEGEQDTYFFYERDRKTTTDRKRIVKKLRAHFHYVVKQQRHKVDYGVDRIRAVVVETIDDNWAMHLRSNAAHPLVSGKKASPLFWFTTSRLFEFGPDKTKAQSYEKRRDYFLSNPDIIFHPIWAPSSEEVFYSLKD